MCEYFAVECDMSDHANEQGIVYSNMICVP